MSLNLSQDVGLQFFVIRTSQQSYCYSIEISTPVVPALGETPITPSLSFFYLSLSLFHLFTSSSFFFLFISTTARQYITTGYHFCLLFKSLLPLSSLPTAPPFCCGGFHSISSLQEQQPPGIYYYHYEPLDVKISRLIFKQTDPDLPSSAVQDLLPCQMHQVFPIAPLSPPPPIIYGVQQQLQRVLRTDNGAYIRSSRPEKERFHFAFLFFSLSSFFFPFRPFSLCFPFGCSAVCFCFLAVSAFGRPRPWC